MAERSAQTAPGTAPERLLDVKGLKTHFTTRDGVVKAVDGVDFTLDAGETLAIVGESGSGKSVTVASVMRLVPDPPGRIVAGQILFKGKDVLVMSEEEMRDLRGDRIAMVFQDPMTSLNPVYQVGAQIAESIMIHRPHKTSALARLMRVAGWALALSVLVLVTQGLTVFSEQASPFVDDTLVPLWYVLAAFAAGLAGSVLLKRARRIRMGDAWDRAVELLDLVGIPNAEQRAADYPHQFSGGMRQRAMIAMALSCDPDVLVADEPTTALDVTIQAQIIDLMMALRDKTGSAIILITHDLGVVADVADRVMVMYAGRPVEYGTADEVFYEPAHPYTWGLLDSLPRYDVEEKGKLRPIEGQPPSLIDMPAGCPFGPRCPYAGAACGSVAPELQEVSPGHFAACARLTDGTFSRVRATEGESA